MFLVFYSEFLVYYTDLTLCRISCDMLRLWYAVLVLYSILLMLVKCSFYTTCVINHVMLTFRYMISDYDMLLLLIFNAITFILILLIYFYMG